MLSDVMRQMKVIITSSQDKELMKVMNEMKEKWWYEGESREENERKNNYKLLEEGIDDSRV